MQNFDCTLHTLIANKDEIGGANERILKLVMVTSKFLRKKSGRSVYARACVRLHSHSHTT